MERTSTRAQIPSLVANPLLVSSLALSKNPHSTAREADRKQATDCTATLITEADSSLTQQSQAQQNNHQLMNKYYYCSPKLAANKGSTSNTNFSSNTLNPSNKA